MNTSVPAVNTALYRITSRCGSEESKMACTAALDKLDALFARAKRKEIDMLGDENAAANLAVKDLRVARRFYEETLGLKKVGAESDELVVYKSGNTTLNVYRSQYAGTNKATAVTWAVGDRITEIVKTLAATGVKFEHYDMPETKREGDIHVSGDMKVAWFKDPDGNILNLASR
jgi:catechol-2,3-dioxygenase